MIVDDKFNILELTIGWGPTVTNPDNQDGAWLSAWKLTLLLQHGDTQISLLYLFRNGIYNKGKFKIMPSKLCWLHDIRSGDRLTYKDNWSCRGINNNNNNEQVFFFFPEAYVMVCYLLMNYLLLTNMSGIVIRINSFLHSAAHSLLFGWIVI